MERRGFSKGVTAAGLLGLFPKNSLAETIQLTQFWITRLRIEKKGSLVCLLEVQGAGKNPRLFS
jgi:hypothetical protein